MTSRVLPLAVVTAFALAVTGCASSSNVESTETSPVPTLSSSSSSSSSSEKSSEKSASSTSRSSEEPRRSESSEAVASKSSSSSEGPRSTWRGDRDSQRDARSSSVGASGDSAKLVEQLNDASRELATLRAQNAKLRAERDRPAPASSTSSSSSTASAASAATATAKADPADEKLAASLKSYAQFKQEMVTIFAEVERMRKENAGMSANLKAAVEQVDHARATIAKLETDLRTERKSRADAEYAASQLRDQLRTIARALNSAGLSVDKISSATETASR